MEQINGIVDSIIYQNNENGYTVLDIESGDGDIYTAVGSLSTLIPGERVTLTGEWAHHSNYGRQFKVESVTRQQIKTADDQYNYLASGAIKGIREGIARRIIETFGEDSFNVIENDPLRLAKIKGISKEKAKEISEAFKKTFAEREVIISLEKYSVTPAEALKIYKYLGSKSVDFIEKNPYIICNENIGLSFEKACSIAELLPVTPDDNYRYCAGVKHILTHNLSNGHTCIPLNKIIAPCRSLLGIDDNTTLATIENMNESGEIVKREVYGKDFLFLPDMYKAELDCAKELLFRKRFNSGGNPVTDERIQKIEIISGIVYNQIQKRAIRTAVEQGLLILTGGPGTGKTTTIRAIISLFEDDGIEAVLCAPTGRAAKRMSELTGREAKTIHRLLEVEWDKNDKPVFTRNRRNPVDAQAIIADELSMVDVRLFSSLLDALPVGCRLILVGDSDQLPPVGAGNVLQDIIYSKLLPVVELDEVFRQAMQSTIVVNAHKIIKGELPDLTVKDNDFFFMKRVNATSTSETVAELISKRLPSAYGFSALSDIQVIAPSKIGENGTVSLNSRLQSVLNPPSRNKKEIKFGSVVFREGDKVMQTKNNYDLEWVSAADSSTGLGIFNGDIGIIRKINPADSSLEIRFDDKDVSFPIENISQLDHAYAITVHKSQGSEFKAVIIPAFNIPEKLAYRNLLYTAVTRACDILIIVGDEVQIASMVNNNSKAKRYSALQGFLHLENKDVAF